MNERMHPNLMYLFKGLKYPNSVPLKQALGLAAQVLKILFPEEGANFYTENLQEAEIIENEKVLSMEEELNLILKNADAPPLESEDFHKLK
jgi:hypothetical protein